MISYPYPTLPGVSVRDRVHHDVDTVLWCRCGSAEVVVGGERIRMPAGSALWISAGVEHSVATPGGCVLVPVSVSPGSEAAHEPPWRHRVHLTERLVAMLHVAAMESLSLLVPGESGWRGFHGRLEAAYADRGLPSVLPASCSPWIDEQHEPLLLWCTRGRARVTLARGRGAGVHVESFGADDALLLPAGVAHRVDTEPGGSVVPVLPTPAQVSTEPLLVRIPARLRAALLFKAVADLGVLTPEVWESTVTDEVLETAHPLRVGPEPEDRRLAWVRRIQRVLHDDPGSAVGVEDWAVRLGVTSRTVDRAFLEHAGTSFTGWRQGVRMGRAADWLDEGRQAKWIASRLGYAHLSAFSRAFSREVGVTVREHQARARASVPRLC